MTWWSVPPVFSGRTIVVMASGPSMNATDVAKVRERDLPTIVVNDTFRLAPWAWMLYAADWRWWERTPDAFKFAGHKVSAAPCIGDVLKLRNTGIDGFDEDPRCVRTGNNSGHQAVHVAVHTLAARILLLGFDMHGGHWNGRSDGPLRRDWIARFAIFADAVRDRVDIINCTPKSALTCFPMVPLKEALG